MCPIERSRESLESNVVASLTSRRERRFDVAASMLAARAALLSTTKSAIQATAFAIPIAAARASHAARPAEPASGGNAYTSAYDSMTQSDLAAHVGWLADPDREGRGTPSLGLAESSL
jgi:hypothetical protein